MVSGNITERIGITARLDIVAVQRPLVNFVTGIRDGVKVLAGAVIDYCAGRLNCAIGIGYSGNTKGAYLESYSNRMVSRDITERIGITARLDIVAVQRP